MPFVTRKARIYSTMISMKTAIASTAALGLASIFALGMVQAESPQTPVKVLDDACWTQSFIDEFDNIDFWNADTNTGQWRTQYIWPRDVIINNELQYYIDPAIHGVSPFSTNDGVLTITATPTPVALAGKVSNQPYVSGVLTTENGFSQQYGRFEARAKVPTGKGLWSAFWLLPSFDQWPDGVAVLPEIDVMEHIGHEQRTYHTTLHTNQNGKLESHPFDHTFNVNLSDDFHLYSVVWTPDNVDWYFDKKWVARYPTPKDYTKPVHFLLNLAVGGTWPGAPNESTGFPARYNIDYVKAYTDNGRCK